MAHLVCEAALGEGVGQLGVVYQVLQVVADVFGRVLVQDGADEVLVVGVVIVIAGVGVAEGGGPLDGSAALHRRSLGAALQLLHAEHQVIFHDACCCVDKRKVHEFMRCTLHNHHYCLNIEDNDSSEF